MRSHEILRVLAMLLERCMRRCVRVTMNADCACTRVPVPACLYPRALRVTLRVTLAHPQFRQRLQTTVRSHEMRSHEMRSHEMRSHEMRPAAPAHSDARSFRCQIIQMPDHSDDPARDPARPCNAACNAA